MTEFTTNDVSAALHVSHRQLQWWDEQGVIRPRHQGHSRFYSHADVVLVCAVAALRERHLSLQNIRRCLRKLRDDLDRLASLIMQEGGTVFLILRPDCRQLIVAEDRAYAFDAVLSFDKSPVILVEIGPEARRILLGPDPQRSKRRR